MLRFRVPNSSPSSLKLEHPITFRWLIVEAVYFCDKRLKQFFFFPCSSGGNTKGFVYNVHHVTYLRFAATTSTGKLLASHFCPWKKKSNSPQRLISKSQGPCKNRCECFPVAQLFFPLTSSSLQWSLQHQNFRCYDFIFETKSATLDQDDQGWIWWTNEQTCTSKWE